MRPNIKLTLHPHERAALRNLSAEERAAVVDEMLAHVRDDLEWLVALEAARAEAPARADALPDKSRLRRVK
jgi:hypothetical protein